MENVRQMKGIQGNPATLRGKQARWNRTQLLALSAQLMSGILEDVAVSAGCPKLTALDRSLKSLERVAPLQCRVLELHSMGGFSIKATAEILKTSEENVLCALSLAEEWLGRELEKDPQRTQLDRSSTVLVTA